MNSFRRKSWTQIIDSLRFIPNWRHPKLSHDSWMSKNNFVLSFIDTRALWAMCVQWPEIEWKSNERIAQNDAVKLSERCRSFHFNYKINESTACGILMPRRNFFGSSSDSSLRFVNFLPTSLYFSPFKKLGSISTSCTLCVDGVVPARLPFTRIS